MEKTKSLGNSLIYSGVLGVFLLASNLAHSAPVVQYDESVSGDILIDTFNLGVGVNTISGSLRVGQNSDSDPFRFNIADGEQLTSFTFSYSNVTPNDPQTFFGVGYGIDSLSNGRTTIAGVEYYTVFDNIGGPIPIVGSPIDVAAIFLPIGAGLYELRTGESVYSSLNPGGSLDYTISLEVAAVPVPAAAWLFGSGLLGLIGLAKRKV